MKKYLIVTIAIVLAFLLSNCSSIKPKMTVAQLEKSIENCYSVSPSPDGETYILACTPNYDDQADGIDVELLVLNTKSGESTIVATDYFGPNSLYTVDDATGGLKLKEAGDATDITANIWDADMMAFTSSGEIVILTQEMENGVYHCDGVCRVDPITGKVNCYFHENVEHYLYEAFTFGEKIGWVNKAPNGGIWTIEIWNEDGTITILPLDPTKNYGSPKFLAPDILAFKIAGTRTVEFYRWDGSTLEFLSKADDYDLIQIGPDGDLYGISQNTTDRINTEIRRIGPYSQELIATIPTTLTGVYDLVISRDGHFAINTAHDGFYICKAGEECTHYDDELGYSLAPEAFVELADGFGVITIDWNPQIPVMKYQSLDK